MTSPKRLPRYGFTYATKKEQRASEEERMIRLIDAHYKTSGRYPLWEQFVYYAFLRHDITTLMDGLKKRGLIKTESGQRITWHQLPKKE